MTEQLHVETETYTIAVDNDVPAIVHRWEGFSSGEEYRQHCEELLAFIQDHDYSKILIDTSGIKAHHEEDKEWLQEEWIPREIDAGIEYSVSVTSDSVISRTEMETFVDQAQGLPFTYVLADDEDEAKAWLAEQ